MAWGPLVALFLRALPELLWLWRKRAERNEREAWHEDARVFREALVAGDGDRLGVLLERRVREARRIRARRP